MAKAYKYRGGKGILNENKESIFKRDIECIINNQFFATTKNGLNDPTEGFYNDSNIWSFFKKHKKESSNVKKIYCTIKDKLNTMGIYSLSKNNSNELLWAYYASGHTGFAIEYDIDLLEKSLNYNQHFHMLYPIDVNYVEDVPVLDESIFKCKNELTIIKKCLGTKSKSWSHEEEYRLILDNNGFIDIDYKAITGIYFGYRMENEEIEYIMDKLKGRGLQYYKMNLENSSYKFVPKKIEDKYLNANKYIANKVDYDLNKLITNELSRNNKSIKYKDELTEAIKSLEHESLIKEIYLATINMDTPNDPLFIIWAYTKKGIPPTKEFNFRLNNKGKIQRIL